MNSHVDQNHVRTLIAVDSSNGTSIVAVTASPSTHALDVADGSIGTDFGPQNSLHDENHATTLVAVSSRTATVNGVDYVQGVTPVVIYADSSGHILTQSM